MVRIDARAVADAQHSTTSPTSLLVDCANGAHVVLASGSPHEVDHHDAAHTATRVDARNALLLPGLANAHCHLDLTAVGPRPARNQGGFAAWLNMVREARLAMDDEAVIRSVESGIHRSLEGGVVAVADIVGTPGGIPKTGPVDALRKSCLQGTSHLELIDIGSRRGASRSALLEAIDAMPGGVRDRGVVLGLSPHAPNTVEPAGYLWAVDEARRRGMPLMTHLAESPEERAFIAEASGPQFDLLERLGLVDDVLRASIGRGLHPVEHLAPVLEGARFSVAHVNDAPDRAIEILASTGATVCYCPRATSYFGHDRSFGAHRFEAMLDAGIPVALGTDSIINLPGPSITTLDEMRWLHRTSGTDPARLLAMATVHASVPTATARESFLLGEGSTPLGILAFERCESLTDVMTSDTGPVRAI